VKSSVGVQSIFWVKPLVRCPKSRATRAGKILICQFRLRIAFAGKKLGLKFQLLRPAAVMSVPLGARDVYATGTAGCLLCQSVACSYA
jgi:hypothetical protein